MTLPAFQLLVDAHWRDVARLARALAGPVDGDDVAQQTWTQAMAAYPTLHDARNLRGWLMTVTSRCAMDVHRGRGRRAVPGGAAEDLLRPGSRATSVPGADAALVDDELWGCVGDLPERQRTALVLRYVVDLDHAAIARTLDTTPTATRRLVSDALATLRTTARPPARSSACSTADDKDQP